jgi:hypothetical protein
VNCEINAADESAVLACKGDEPTPGIDDGGAVSDTQAISLCLNR